jgi:NAD(P)-dependent dehydrogenase (short-subunit alcohol dehydrogenase family)
VKSHAGRVVLITGGTRGLGLATALVFAAHGAQTVRRMRSALPTKMRSPAASSLPAGRRR